MITWQGKEIATDKEGFLLNNVEWNEELAIYMASLETVQLTAEHWVIMHYLREYYEDYDIAPPMRVMVKVFANHFGSENANSRYLHKLFPKGPAKQGSRFAGLPKPKNCL